MSQFQVFELEESGIDDSRETTPFFKYMCSLEGHRHTVKSVKFSPCGNYLATGSEDRTIQIFDVLNIKFLKKIVSGHGGCINEVCWSSDSRSIVTASDDGTLKLFDASTGECLRTFFGHLGEVLCCDFHPEDNVLISGSRDQTIRFWSSGNGNCLEIIEVLHGDVIKVNHKNISYSSQKNNNRYDSIFCSSSSDGSVQIWSTEMYRSKCIKTMRTFSSPAKFVKFSDDDKFFITGPLNDEIETLDFCDRRYSKLYFRDWNVDNCLSVSFSLNRHKCIVGGSENAKIYIWDLKKKELAQTLIGHKSAVVSTDCHPFRNLIASGGLQPDPVVRFWKANG